MSSLRCLKLEHITFREDFASVTHHIDESIVPMGGSSH